MHDGGCGDGCWAVQGWVSGWSGDGCWAGSGLMNPVKPVGQVWGRGQHSQGTVARSRSAWGTCPGPGSTAGSGRCCGWPGLSSAAGPTELRARHGLRLFTLERSCCYEALLLDEERGRLFAGAQNNLLSLALDDISQRDRKVTRGETHMPAMGPRCTPGL